MVHTLRIIDDVTTACTKGVMVGAQRGKGLLLWAGRERESCNTVVHAVSRPSSHSWPVGLLAQYQKKGEEDGDAIGSKPLNISRTSIEAVRGHELWCGQGGDGG